MRKTTITWIIGSIVMVGMSAAMSDYWFLPVLWGLIATMWAFIAGGEYTDKAWREVYGE